MKSFSSRESAPQHAATHPSNPNPTLETQTAALRTYLDAPHRRLRASQKSIMRTQRQERP